MISGTGVPFHFQQHLGSLLAALRAIWLFSVWMVMLTPRPLRGTAHSSGCGVDIAAP
jgi:hypothetical protein